MLFLLVVYPSISAVSQEKEQPTETAQAERRTQRRLQVGGIFFPQLPLLRINYNLTSNLSVFLTAAAFRGGTITGLSFDDNTNSLVETKSEWNAKANFSSVGVDWFPFDKIPMHLTGLIGSQQLFKVTAHEYLTVNPLNHQSVIQESPYAYTATPRRASMIGLGIGFRWVFSNGIYLGVQFIRYYAEQKVDFFVYTEPRLGASASVLDVWAYQKYLEQRFGTMEYFQMFYPYVGFSF
ncbi:hypothetical protein EHQ12_11695 [Leptospira gomenensis]|uniref:Outer membrane protein beta-barrel domain-containing protein n=1 Tax=Leptospira gomenensis TaxID=2484974 RepID=A0A5F1YYB2_9LEPT|nr:hypothetical protein [Leptospira gomenensis]TGK34957.1 hypothetical protein EHQ17_07970 [Leptospira gomenensis]TGK36753.1 hypothetical protein EHQ12_11695 [Leptospira gomenensis]TGK48842.1 hypothetical protein EHQ07_05740 [Leptospira gomenensis]TGK64608.1 hypothetical protein EHQ13_06915 [Leptospira gomenensis]